MIRQFPSIPTLVEVSTEIRRVRRESVDTIAEAYREAFRALELMESISSAATSPVSERYGSWDVTRLRGTQYRVVCRKCSLKGVISINDDPRTICPRCSDLAPELWPGYGFGPLVKEAPTKTRVPVGVTSVEDAIEELLDDSSIDVIENGVLVDPPEALPLVDDMGMPLDLVDEELTREADDAA